MRSRNFVVFIFTNFNHQRDVFYILGHRSTGIDLASTSSFFFFRVEKIRMHVMLLASPDNSPFTYLTTYAIIRNYFYQANALVTIIVARVAC